MTRYFAHGSIFWNEQMRTRCPHGHRIGPAALHGYRWIITTRGYASVVPSPGGAVEGVLFGLTESDEAAMDRFEAVVYIDPITNEGEPNEEYVRRINAGLSAGYVERQVRRFIPA